MHDALVCDTARASTARTVGRRRRLARGQFKMNAREFALAVAQREAGPRSIDEICRSMPDIPEKPDAILGPAFVTPLLLNAKMSRPINVNYSLAVNCAAS